MDISALSLALGATVETVGQVTGEAGFDAVLAQVDPEEFIPPGAPPGPEPPPDLLVAGEEVEVVEPNAQPHKLDFHPLQKVDIDVELPKPFWEASADTDQVDVSTQSSGPADEAMKWLVGQMSDSFFKTPDLATGCPTPNGDQTGAKVDPTGSKGEVYYFCPSDFNERFKLIDTESGWCGTDTLEPYTGTKPVPLPEGKPDYTGARPQKTVGPAIDQDISEGLKVVLVHTDPEQSDMGEKSRDAIYGTKKPLVNPSDECPAPPKPVGFPNNDKVPAGFNGTKEMWRSMNEGVKPDQKDATAAADLVRTKPPRDSNSEEKAIKLDDSKAVDADTTVVTGKPAGESTLDGSQSHDKKATSKSEWAELAPAKRSGKPVESEETKVDGDKLIDLSSAVISATPELKKPSLKPEEAELVVKQVADKLHMLAAARPRNGVTIHLNPDDLGSITVVIKSVGRMVDTQITASDPRVSEALDQNRTRLVEAMDSKGFQLQSVTVSQQSGHSTQQDSSSRSWQQANQEQSQRQNQSGQQQGHRGHNDRQFDQPKANIRAWVRRGEGVDLAI